LDTGSLDRGRTGGGKEKISDAAKRVEKRGRGSFQPGRGNIKIYSDYRLPQVTIREPRPCRGDRREEAKLLKGREYRTERWCRGIR